MGIISFANEGKGLMIMQTKNIKSRPIFLRNVILLFALFGVCAASFAGNDDFAAYWAVSNPGNMEDFDNLLKETHKRGW